MTRSITRNVEEKGYSLRAANIELDIQEGLRSSDKRTKKVKPGVRKSLLWKFTKFRPAEAEVKCGRVWHTVKFTDKGRLVLCDHSDVDLDTQVALKSLGSRHRCRCMTVKKHFIRAAQCSNGIVVSVPPALHVELARAKRRKTARMKRKGRRGYEPDQYKVPFTLRASVVAKVLKKKLKESSLFASPEGRISPKYPVKVRITSSITEATKRGCARTVQFNSTYLKMDMPLISEQMTPADLHNVLTRPVFNKWQRRKPYVQPCYGLSFTGDWWQKVYKKGIAVVDGCIVLATGISPVKNPNATSVSIIRLGSLEPSSPKSKDPATARSVSYWGAEIEQNAYGEWHITKLDP